MRRAAALGLHEADTQALIAGQCLTFESLGLIGFLMARDERLTAGIFSVNAPGHGIQLLTRFRAQSAAMGRPLGAKELELMGAEFTNSSFHALLVRQGFSPATIEAPATLGGGPMDVLRKVSRL